jgi:hypothetical protein
MVIFCVYTREQAKKPPNSEAYTRIEKKTFSQPSHHPKNKVRDCSLAYTYTYTLKEITALSPLYVKCVS